MGVGVGGLQPVGRVEVLSSSSAAADVLELVGSGDDDSGRRAGRADAVSVGGGRERDARELSGGRRGPLVRVHELPERAELQLRQHRHGLRACLHAHLQEVAFGRGARALRSR